MSITVSDDEKLHPVASIFVAIVNIKPSDQTVCRLIRTGELEARKVLGKWFCRVADVNAYIDRSTNRKEKREKSKPAKTRSEKARAKAVAAANEELTRAGV